MGSLGEGVPELTLDTLELHASCAQLGLKVGVLPLLALVAADILARRREHDIQLRNS